MGKEIFYRYLHDVALIPREKLRLRLFLLAFRLLRLTSGYYPNEIAFWLLNSNKCMLALRDIVLVGGW
jgi:hypothetical protein